MTAPDLEIRNPKFIDRMVGHRSESGIDGFLGATVVEMEAGRLVVEFAVGDEHLTFIGNMHGGCLAALCDHCLGVVLYPVMPPGSWAATTEFKVNYLRPVSGEPAGHGGHGVDDEEVGGGDHPGGERGAPGGHCPGDLHGEAGRGEGRLTATSTPSSTATT